VQGATPTHHWLAAPLTGVAGMQVTAAWGVGEGRWRGAGAAGAASDGGGDLDLEGVRVCLIYCYSATMLAPASRPLAL
jgi:hypothetical protein